MKNTAQQGRPAVAAGRPLPDVIGRRHTFAWEQVLAFLAQRDRDGSGVVVGKREVAEGLHMSPNTADRAMVPTTTVEITDPESVAKVTKLIDWLEDYDDVQEVYHDADLPDEEEDE